MKELIEKLNSLKSHYNVVGIKQSFEDEGALLDDVIKMRRITELCNMYLSVKIGGCEAISDINNCVRLGANGIVAPMIETEFALQKYIESVVHVNDIKFYVNLESKTAYSNLDAILNSPASKMLTGIVVGRSDLTKSYGYDKNYADSDFIFNIVHDIIKKSKSYGFTTLMGGNISNKSCEFIKQLYEENILDYIETRNVIVKLNDHNINNLQDAVKSILIFETEWLKYKSVFYGNISNEYLTRSILLNNRIDNE